MHSPKTLNYISVVDSYFGPGSCVPPVSSPDNPIMGALLSKDHKVFSDNFHHRLERLASAVATDQTRKIAILKTINQIAGRNWMGHYAEIAALDLFCSHRMRHFLLSLPKLDVDVDATQTFAGQMGRTKSNYDGYFEDFGVYFDIKALKDNVGELLTGIIDQAKNQAGILDPKLIIRGEYSFNLHYEDFQKQRNALVCEIQEKLVSSNRTVRESYKSKVLPELAFVFTWNGISSTVHELNPYERANRYHADTFLHMDKFHKGAPCFLAYVLFPWYNQVLPNYKFSDTNKIFYRSFARRIFCQYQLRMDPASAFDSKFTGPETIGKVSNHLSGIVFLEDHTILDLGKANNWALKSHWYFNPNAVYPIGRIFFDYLNSDLQDSVMSIDSFDGDNY